MAVRERRKQNQKGEEAKHRCDPGKGSAPAPSHGELWWAKYGFAQEELDFHASHESLAKTALGQAWGKSTPRHF